MSPQRAPKIQGIELTSAQLGSRVIYQKPGEPKRHGILTDWVEEDVLVRWNGNDYATICNPSHLTINLLKSD